jgi:hypothetical protein
LYKDLAESETVDFENSSVIVSNSNEVHIPLFWWLPTQEEYVRACQNEYRKLGLVPGDEHDGRWENAHHPEPRCLHGEGTVLLLKHHHAVHNIIQSEELGHPCVYSWELAYLPPEYRPLFFKWATMKHRLSVTRRAAKSEVAFERAPSPSYWPETNPSKPKPVIIHYRDGTTVYCESIKQASRLTSINQSTIQHRLKKNVKEQFGLAD